MRRPIFACLVLVLGSALASAQDEVWPRFARVTTDGARARAGAHDFDAEVARLARGDVVEIVARREDWAEVRLPGGFPVWIQDRIGDRPSLREERPGEGLVLLDGVRVFPQPEAELQIGNLYANDRVLIVGAAPGGWREVVPAAESNAFVLMRLLETPPAEEQAALGRAFADRAARVAAARRESLAGDPKTPADGALRQELVALDTEMDALLVSSPSSDKLADLRRRFEDFARRSPEGSAEAVAAKRRVDLLRDRERVAADLETAEERIAALERELGGSDKAYVERLEQIRAARSGEARAGVAADEARRNTRFLEHGIGQLYKDFGDSIGDRPIFLLVKAGERRYRLISDRYDLSEYRDKTIGITKWERIDDRSTSPWPKILVERLEILP